MKHDLSPPPCGEWFGVEVVQDRAGRCLLHHPHLLPPPHKGEENARRAYGAMSGTAFTTPPVVSAAGALTGIVTAAGFGGGVSCRCSLV